MLRDLLLKHSVRLGEPAPVRKVERGCQHKMGGSAKFSFVYVILNNIFIYEIIFKDSCQLSLSFHSATNVLVLQCWLKNLLSIPQSVTHVYTCVYVYMHVCFIYLNKCHFVDIYMHICTHICLLCEHMYVYTYMCVYNYFYEDVCVHICVYI